MTPFSQKVYRVVSHIPKGETLSYKEVARRAGSPRAARAVGNILNKNPYAPGSGRSFAKEYPGTSFANDVPCHRVVCSDGSVGGYAHGAKEKIRLLKSEGVTIRNGKVIT